MQRSLLLVLIGLVIGGAALIILSIWGVDLGAALFKILATIGVLILLVGFLMVVKMDFGEHKRLKDQDYLD
ncbi:MAG: hypothetical protein KA155_09460 [Alphaproteobacteria bacterium]|jgi:high-affinity Fe2+/Pb2+ permease|nr:hypothetical protein [Alphaproteobacteria bacterium]